MKFTTDNNSRTTTPLQEMRASTNRERRKRRIVVAILFVLIFVLLDRMTVYFQMWSGISAWYPPSAITLAILLGMESGYLPVMVFASFIAAKVNYHQDIVS